MYLIGTLVGFVCHLFWSQNGQQSINFWRKCVDPRDNIQHASILFSQIVSLIRVFLLCRAGNRQYYIVVGFAIHEHTTA